MYTPEKTFAHTYWTTFYVNINRPSQISGGIAVSNVIQLCHKLLPLKIDLFLIILHQFRPFHTGTAAHTQIFQTKLIPFAYYGQLLYFPRCAFQWGKLFNCS